MTELPNDERRVHPRTRIDVAATLDHAGDSVNGIVENVGRGGVFFATEELDLVVDDAAEVTLRFEFEGKSVERIGHVLRTERYFDGTRVVRAFAVKFVEPLDDSGVVVIPPDEG